MADLDTDTDTEEGAERPSKVVYDLKVIVEYKGEERTDITIRRPKLKDMKKINALRGSDADRAAAMIALLSGWAPAAVDELDGADVDGISKIIDSFS